MENATTAGSSQCNISRIYIWKDKKSDLKPIITTTTMSSNLKTLTNTAKTNDIKIFCSDR